MRHGRHVAEDGDARVVADHVHGAVLRERLADHERAGFDRAHPVSPPAVGELVGEKREVHRAVQRVGARQEESLLRRAGPFRQVGGDFRERVSRVGVGTEPRLQRRHHVRQCRRELVGALAVGEEIDGDRSLPDFARLHGVGASGERSCERLLARPHLDGSIPGDGPLRQPTRHHGPPVAGHRDPGRAGRPVASRNRIPGPRPRGEGRGAVDHHLAPAPGARERDLELDRLAFRDRAIEPEHGLRRRRILLDDDLRPAGRRFQRAEDDRFSDFDIEPRCWPVYRPKSQSRVSLEPSLVRVEPDVEIQTDRLPGWLLGERERGRCQREKEKRERTRHGRRESAGRGTNALERVVPRRYAGSGSAGCAYAAAQRFSPSRCRILRPCR